MNFTGKGGSGSDPADSTIARLENARVAYADYYVEDANTGQMRLKPNVNPSNPKLLAAELAHRQAILVRSREIAAINIAMERVTIPEAERTGAMRTLVDLQAEYQWTLAVYERTEGRSLTDRINSPQFAAYQRAIEDL